MAGTKRDGVTRCVPYVSKSVLALTYYVKTDIFCTTVYGLRALSLKERRNFGVTSVLFRFTIIQITHLLSFHGRAFPSIPGGLV